MCLENDLISWPGFVSEVEIKGSATALEEPHQRVLYTQKWSEDFWSFVLIHPNYLLKHFGFKGGHEKTRYVKEEIEWSPWRFLSLSEIAIVCILRLSLSVPFVSVIAFNAEKAQRRVFSEEKCPLVNKGGPSSWGSCTNGFSKDPDHSVRICVWLGQAEMPPGYPGVWTRTIRHNIFRLLYTTEKKNKS